MRPGEELIVWQFIVMYYGFDFAAEILNETKRRPTRSFPVELASAQDPRYSQANLTLHHFKFVGTFGNTDTQVWQNPFGRVVWLTPARLHNLREHIARPEHPTVTDAKAWVSELTAAKDKLLRQLSELRASERNPNYLAMSRQFWDDTNTLVNTTEVVLEEHLPRLKDEADAVDGTAIEAEIARATAIKVWLEGFTELAGRLLP